MSVAILPSAFFQKRFHFADDGFGLLVSLRAGECEIHAQFCAKDKERIGDIVSVTDKSDCLSAEVAELFSNGLGKGKCLTRMRIICEGVDDRNGSVFGELFDKFLLETAHDQRIYPAGKAGGDIVDAFAFAKSDGIGGKENG